MSPNCTQITFVRSETMLIEFFWSSYPCIPSLGALACPHVAAQADHVLQVCNVPKLPQITLERSETMLIEFFWSSYPC